jgi:hypothetical protein
LAAAANYRLSLSGSQYLGVEVTAEGEDEAWAHGIVDVFRKKLLAVGEVGEYADRRRPLTRAEATFSASAVMLCVAVLVGAALLEWDWFYVIWAFLLTGALLTMGLPFDMYDRKVRNPHLAVIGPADRLPTPERDGPVWRLQRWLGEHPVVQKLIEWTMAGSIGALLAKLIG